LGEGVRSSAFRSCTIFFVVERDEVLIVWILHGARDITAPSPPHPAGFSIGAAQPEMVVMFTGFFFRLR
jgi:hypothetical protein